MSLSPSTRATSFFGSTPAEAHAGFDAERARQPAQLEFELAFADERETEFRLHPQ